MAKKRKTKKKVIKSKVSTKKDKTKAAAVELHGVPLKRSDGTEISIPTELYNRASKKAGMSDEMIATYPDAESLKRACDKISPRTNPDARPGEGVVPPPVKYEDNRPDVFEFDSKMEAKFISQNRAQFDENELQLKLREINRRYGPQKLVKIIKTTTFKPVKGITKDKLSAMFLVTHYEVHFK